MKTLTKNKIEQVLNCLESLYPDAECALDHKNRFELLVAVMLSAQTTDKSVNLITPALFERYYNADKLATANLEDVQNLIMRIGLYKNKAKNIVNMSKILQSEYRGEVPSSYDELIKLPGVGRKTANVVLSVGFGEPRIAVDTHVFRVANRIGLADTKNIIETENQLMKNIPKDRWSRTHHSLIFHGRNLCKARKPDCELCKIAEFCKFYGK
ncbi:MAG: endonuclease III [Eubacteriales bacterium]